MKLKGVLAILLFSAAVQANTLAAEEFKPIGLGDAQATEIVDQAIAEAKAVANADAVSSAVPATESSETKKSSDLIKPKLAESEIPVLTKVRTEKVEAKSPWSRLLLSLGVIAIVAVGLIQTAKWWQKRSHVNTDTNKIRVLNQHFLGPRKSLAIIRVAGETILIGVTDQNISHIKTLALLEGDDLPAEVPKNFANELQKKEDEKEEESESAWSSIRDRVSTKIKDMRPL